MRRKCYQRVYIWIYPSSLSLAAIAAASDWTTSRPGRRTFSLFVAGFPRFRHQDALANRAKSPRRLGAITNGTIPGIQHIARRQSSVIAQMAITAYKNADDPGSWTLLRFVSLTSYSRDGSFIVQNMMAFYFVSITFKDFKLQLF